MMTGLDREQDYFSGPRGGGRRLRMAGRMLLAALAGVVVLVGTIAMVQGMHEMYAKCGLVCRQGLQQVTRNRL